MPLTSTKNRQSHAILTIRRTTGILLPPQLKNIPEISYASFSQSVRCCQAHERRCLQISRAAWGQLFIPIPPHPRTKILAQFGNGILRKNIQVSQTLTNYTASQNVGTFNRNNFHYSINHEIRRLIID